MRLAAAALLLSGCAIIKPDYYQTMPTAQICNQIAAYPPWNVNHPARYRELERRGHSCGDPNTIAAGQRAATQQLLDAAQTIQPPPPPVTCTTYQVNRNQSTTTCR